MPEQQQGAAAAASQTVGQEGLLDQIVEQGRITTTKERGKDLVKEFVAQVLDGSMKVSADAEAMINQRIADIDRVLSAQLNEIHPAIWWGGLMGICGAMYCFKFYPRRSA